MFKDTLKFITCGSVDDGKSTLIGRMLYEANLISDDSLEEIKNDSKKYFNDSDQIDFSLLVDGLSAEREQGITIDIAYRYFNTKKRKFIVADTPGHLEYTRNMFTGASNADLAIILIDATKGVLEQSKRHSFICSSIGIKHIILAVNKMDLIDYNKIRYDEITHDFKDFVQDFKFDTVKVIPISALKSDNIITNSNKTKWFKSEPLLTFLENVEITDNEKYFPLRLPIQIVNKFNDKRYYAGTVVSGQISVGNKITVLPSKETAKVTDIFCGSTHFKTAIKEQSISLTLDKEIDLRRGDLITSFNQESTISNQFKVLLIWLDKNIGFQSRNYLLKLGSTSANAQITKIDYKININNLENLSASRFEVNNFYIVNMLTDKPIPFDKFDDCKSRGSFILIDKINNQTIAAGMIKFSLYRNSNVTKQNLSITRTDRNFLNGHKSKVLWLTGISGAGKSTIADALEKELFSRGLRSFILDGDNLRLGINKDLGFTDADRVENIRRVGEIAKIMYDAGIITIVALVSPFKAERDSVKNLFDKDDFFEIFVDTSIKTAEKRDVKGLYKKARKGEIPNFTGINSNYENPINPDVHINTEFENIQTIVSKIIKKLDIQL